MHRRQYLALASGAVLASAAGCSSPDEDGTGDENATATPTDGGGELSAMAQARAHIEVAAGAVSADASVETYAAVESAYDYDEAALSEALTGAESALDRAESEGSGDARTIDVLRQYVAVIDARAVVNAAIVTVAGHVTTATDQYLDAAYADATTTYEQATAAAEPARTALVTARDAFATLDDRARRDTELPMDEIQAGLNATAEVLTALEAQAAAGFHVAAGLQHRATGHERYNTGEYRRARNSFLEAQSQFEQARTRYRNSEGAVTVAIRAELSLWLCWCQSYLTAAQHMETACTEAIEGEFGPAGDWVKRAREAVRDSDCGPIE